MQNATPFVLPYYKGQITVVRHPVGGSTIYRVTFSDNRVPLVITRANNPDNEKWWTSIPEGRLAEAQEIGKLIEAYLLSVS